jgi:hypothetical protein
MFPKYGGTKVLMAALGSSLSLYFPEPCDPAKYLRFFSENILAKTQRTIVGAAQIERRSDLGPPPAVPDAAKADFGG